MSSWISLTFNKESSSKSGNYKNLTDPASSLEGRDTEIIDKDGPLPAENLRQISHVDEFSSIKPTTTRPGSSSHYTSPPQESFTSVANLGNARSPESVPWAAMFPPKTNANPVDSLRNETRALERLADRTIMKHYELEHEQQTLESCQGFVQQSTEDLVATVDSTLAGENLDVLRPKIAELQSRCRTDNENFKRQASRVKALRVILRQLELKLKRKAERLGRNLSAADRPLVHPQVVRPSASNLGPESTNESLELSSHSDTPTLLAEYYDRKGDVGVFRERLMDLDYNYHDGLAERELIMDRGDPLEVSDEQYYTEFATQRQAILDDLSTAEHDVTLLEVRCEAAGLAIVDTRQQLSSGALSSTSLSGSAHNKGMSALRPVVHARPQPRDGSFLSLRGEHRVRVWLDRLPNSDPGTPKLPAEDADPMDVPHGGVKAFPCPRPLLNRKPISEYAANMVIAGDTFIFDADNRARPTWRETWTHLRRWKSDPLPVQRL